MGSTALNAPREGFRGSKRLLGLRDDDHLVARARAGEVVAFEVLYERHLPGVLSFCRHMLGSREEAEDAVQQAFTSAHRDLVGRDRVINFKPWIYTIARNRCLSMLRVRREDLPENLEQATAGLDSEVQARADLRELVADLQDLPEDQRAALLLSEIRDLSHAEVAEVLGCRAPQVKGLVHRARSGLLERRDARDADCEEIRVELAAARGGGFRRGRLRHHLDACPACSAYWEQVRQQRKMLAVVLPVVPTLGLKADVLAAIGFGGGTAGGLAAGSAAVTGGVATAGGGAMTAATVAKIAAVAVVAGGGGVAGISAIETGPTGDRPPAKRAGEAPSTARKQSAGARNMPALAPAGRAEGGIPGRRDEAPGDDAGPSRGSKPSSKAAGGEPGKTRAVTRKQRGSHKRSAGGRPANPGRSRARSDVAPPSRGQGGAAKELGSRPTNGQGPTRDGGAPQVRVPRTPQPKPRQPSKPTTPKPPKADDPTGPSAKTNDAP